MLSAQPADILPGQSYPLGAHLRPGGVNFCVFSKNCTAVELLLFDRMDDARPARVIRLDPEINRTFYYWHVYVKGIGVGQLYGYRVYGPYDPARGLRFDPAKVLLDPYARVVMYGSNYSRAAACPLGQDNCAHALKGVVAESRTYDWEGDLPLQRPYARSLIYELHIGGFTRHPSSGVAPDKRGTYAGLVDKIPYLRDLGVTAVELLPVHQFDEQDVAPPLKNYWGYNTAAFFAPHRGYCSRPAEPLGPVDEFRDMVKALHRAGIEVILDVVFNHTAEGNHLGPTLSFRGLENRAYYILERNAEYYSNYSGCGNTFNGNHSVARRLILDSLRYWVQAMHVDGFRFDLASVLSRDEEGNPLKAPPTLWEIESDPVLAGTKIIAEAWDAAGLYQVGSFVGHRWAEWNGPFRDDVRRFVKGDDNTVGPLAGRLTGSYDLYHQADREPNRSINFITCHDGFTLNDLVSYSSKHNEANEEGNRDGSDANYSWNCGAEGATANPDVEALRRRQIKNLLTILLISQGTPMMLMGDDVRRTQLGNNNGYCQDNELSWFDWRQVEKQSDLLRFVRLLIKFTQRGALFQEERYWAGEQNGQEAHVTWHGTRLNAPDWSAPAHHLAFSLHDPADGEHLHVLLNAYWQPLEFELPPLPAGQGWQCVVDTALPCPHDFTEPGAAPPLVASTYRAEARSVVVLAARPKS